MRATEKYAILSDVHGNCPALLKVLEDARKRGVDRFVIAGDYCLSGAWPDECITTLKGIRNKHIIRGNEERYLENLIGKDQSTWTDGQMQISYWNYRNIQKENLEYLLNLPHTVNFECGNVKLHVAHASESFIGAHEFREFGPAILAKKYENKAITEEDLSRDIHEILDNTPAFQEKLGSLEEGIYIFGHSHVQWSYKAKDQNILLINPGSCGLPLDAIRESIPYSVLTITETGETQCEEIRIPFPMEQYIEKLKQTSQYSEANVWTKVIIKELQTAREHLTFFLQFAEQYAAALGDGKRPFCVEIWEKAYEAWEQTVPGDG